MDICFAFIFYEVIARQLHQNETCSEVGKRNGFRDLVGLRMFVMTE